jgi:hypothetical protein
MRLLSLDFMNDASSPIQHFPFVTKIMDLQMLDNVKSLKMQWSLRARSANKTSYSLAKRGNARLPAASRRTRPCNKRAQRAMSLRKMLDEMCTSERHVPRIGQILLSQTQWSSDVNWMICIRALGCPIQTDIDAVRSIAKGRSPALATGAQRVRLLLSPSGTERL